MFRILARFFQSAPVRLWETQAACREEQQRYLLAADAVDVVWLRRTYPPVIEHAKKKLLFDLALAKTCSGELRVARFREIPCPALFQPFTPATEVSARKGYFRYGQDDSQVHWFLNFAHHDLFNGYGHFLFAQDEVQVAEHPALASVRQWMLAREDALKPRTMEAHSPTPVLMEGVPRSIAVDTRQIYGARFAQANDETIRSSVRELDPPTLTRILAIEAPIPSGNKIYTRAEIELALRTAYSGFRAAVIQSVVDRDSCLPIVVHTGNWGCGAYGGNRPLMVSLQILAANLAGVSRLIFYCGSDDQQTIADCESGLERRFGLRPGVRLQRVIDRLVQAAFRWGTPDGN